MQKFLVLVMGLFLFGQMAWAEKNPVVKIETSHGEIHFELFQSKAPISTKNFLKYVDEGFYNGTIFHRVIDNFMVQGGGFTSDMKQKKTNSPIKNEATNKIANEEGTIAMARTGVVDSATSQFFINVKNNAFLNHTSTSNSGYGYAVFGKVVKGMSIVNQIKKVKTGRTGRFSDVPVTPVIIKKASRL